MSHFDILSHRKPILDAIGIAMGRPGLPIDDFSYWQHEFSAVARDLSLLAEPLPMILHCPCCGSRHIDQNEGDVDWTKVPHRSHLCDGCGFVWRPADVCTVGVLAIETKGRDDGQIMWKETQT